MGYASKVVRHLLEDGLDHLPRFFTQINVGDDDDVEVEVVYDFDRIGEGDADYQGRSDIAPWIEDIILNGKSIIKSVSDDTLKQLVDEAYAHATGH